MDELESWVLELAEEHFELEPTLESIYWFDGPPGEGQVEIRLVEVNRNAPKTGDVFVISFRPDDATPYRLQIAEVHPDEWRDIEEGRLELPEDWLAVPRRRILRSAA